MYRLNLTDFRVRYFFVLILSITALISCKDNPQKNYNVVIVTFDTTRADHIGSYSEDAAYTPHLNAFAKDSVVYERALAPIAITLPSHSSIMTGKVPFVHGVRDNGLFTLSDEQLTLAEILKSIGYNTGAAIGSYPLTAQFGIDQGFDFYNDYITQNNEDIYGDLIKKKDKIFFDERKASQVNSTILPWLESNQNAPFFAWLHYFDPHHPHEPPKPYDQKYINNLYKGEIAYSDESFGKLIAQLKRTNQYDNTMIIFTSDHGEGNKEHNEATHSLLIYNSTLHVPLIIKYPKQIHANTRINEWVGLVDIFPTVLNSLGLTHNEDIQGKILPTTNESSTSEELYSETLSPRFSRGWGEQRGLVKNGFKYIHGPQKELYNVDEDHKELNNLIDEKPELAEKMKNDLQDYLDEHQVSFSTTNSVNQNPEALDILRGLGYIQSTGKIGEEIIEVLDDSGDAPQSHADMISIYSAAKSLMYSGDHIEALRYIDNLLIEDPENLAYAELKIQAEIELGNYESAKQTIKSLPKDTYGSLTPAKKLSLLASMNYYQGNISDSKSLFQDSENIEKTIGGQYHLAQIYSSEGDLENQQIHLVNILDLDKNNIEALNDLAINFANQGEFSKAEEKFSQAISSNPYHQLSHYNYGVFLSSISDDIAAKKQFTKAIELNSKYINAYYALIETNLKLNDIEQAKSVFNNLKNIAPNNKLTMHAKNLIKNL